MSGSSKAGAPSRVGGSYRQCPHSCVPEKPRVQSLYRSKALQGQTLLQIMLIEIGTSRNATGVDASCY